MKRREDIRRDHNLSIYIDVTNHDPNKHGTPSSSHTPLYISRQKLWNKVSDAISQRSLDRVVIQSPSDTRAHDSQLVNQRAKSTTCGRERRCGGRDSPRLFACWGSMAQWALLIGGGGADAQPGLRPITVACNLCLGA